MNSSRLDLVIHATRHGVISDADFVTSNYALAYVMLVVSLVGVVTNAINIRTFVSMGLADGISVSLMGLAISDFGFTFFGSILSFANVIAAIEIRHNLDNLPITPKFVFGMFSANIGFMFYQVTCMITTFIAIARCMCVAMPFKFKDFFTRSRSIFALVVFNLIAAMSYIPILSQMGVQRKFDPVVNKTRIVLWMSSKRSDIKDVVEVIHFVVFVIVSSVVVAICIVVMAKHLRQSAEFRHSMSTGEVKGEGQGDGDGKGKSSQYRLSGKELQVVQQVIVICIIYTLSLAPTIFSALYRLVEHEYEVGERLHNLYFTIGAFCTILQLVNSATTFPVYYAYNSKFRSRCRSMWACHASASS